MNKITNFILTCFICICLCGCGSIVNNKETEAFDKQEISMQVKSFISKGNSDKLTYFDSTVKLLSGDECNLDDKAGTQEYMSNSSYYLQYGNYLYRFQFNKDNKIDSYIKYKVRG